MTYSKAIDNNFIFSICASWVILLINLGHDGVQFVTNLLIPPFLPQRWDKRLDFHKNVCTWKFKLLRLCFWDNALQWFQSYLIERQQFVTYNGVSSHKKTIKCGVPQSSILGPLLFLVYINDLCHVYNKSIPILFADDTNLFFRDTDPKVMESEINTELDRISLWLKVNKLSLNIKKTHYMIFNLKKKCCCDVMLRIDKQLIEEVSETKFLGVVIDNGLKWKKTYSVYVKKKSKGIGMIIKARHCLNKNALTTLYYSLIYPYMTYCNHIWGCSAASNINKISVLQKKVIRIICRMKPRDSCEPMYSALGIMRFSDVNVYFICKFMFRVCQGDVPEIFRAYFRFNSEIHNYFTRQCDYLHVPIVKSNLGKSNIRYRGVIIWNYIISKGVDLDISEAVFVKMVKRIVVNGILKL